MKDTKTRVRPGQAQNWALSFLLSQFIRPTLGGEYCWASSLLWRQPQLTATSPEVSPLLLWKISGH